MAKQSELTFEITMSDAHATGSPTDNGFVVRADSITRTKTTASPSRLIQVTRRRKRLIDEGVLVEEDSQLRFTRDHQFASPSSAAMCVLGRSANGWTEWKTPDGRTLSDVKRVIRDESHPLLSDATRKALIVNREALLNEDTGFSDRYERYYALFRERFGPQVLRGLDGEALLNSMHDLANRDSLAYWLEFKNDDEFKTKHLGSIAGGSALKFRVFRRKETGNWQAAGERNKPRDISLEEAIQYARDHRDQLLLGVELLEQLPADASDEDYAKLQDDMDELAPDVSDLAWGHKYFSLLYPDKLDDYHNPHFQRFHLLQLLQLPPEGKGRYICAGRYITVARALGFSVAELTGTLNRLQDKPYKYWRIGTTAGETKVSHWQMMQERSCIAVGWPELGDLSWVEPTAASRTRLKALIHKIEPSTPAAEGNATSEITNFIAKMTEGDIVWAAKGATVLGIGRVTGEYEYHADFDFPHQRSVEWLDLGEWQMPVHEGLRSTVREIKKHNENLVETERRLRNRVPEKASSRPIPSVRLQGIPRRIQSVLKRKGQVILYGPPGTGKTYWAVKTAQDLAALSAFHRTFDQLEETQQRTITGEAGQPGTVRMCCFHPAYGYEDFLEGYRPHEASGNVSFILRDGIFKELCRAAASNPQQHYYLIVDEINRGDIPRIFGELLTILEKDKRNKQIVLPVSQHAFTIPDNVFVIGTMNTADRSISLLDAALRRRFGFIELMPDETVLHDAVVAGISLRDWFSALNSRIRQHVGRDARNLQIGHSYFLQAGQPIGDLATLKQALRDDILPLLEEYCYGDFAALQSILGSGLLDVENQQIRHDLFDQGQDDELVQAILEPCPEISASAAALSSDEERAETEIDDEDELDEDEDN